MPDMFEAAEAKRLRDVALAKVTIKAGNWPLRARLKIRSLPPGWEGTGEDIRLHLATSGFEQPHHHNAWGAVINTCLHHGWLQQTGRWRNMRTRKSHARNTQIYRRTHKP